MLIHQREIAYSSDYETFFAALVTARDHVHKRFPDVTVELLYNLAGQRGYATVLTRYRSLAEYERVDAELDRDDAYRELLEAIVGTSGERPVDQFFRVID